MMKETLMKRFALCIFLILFNTTLSLANPKEDANYIVEQTVTRTLFEASIQTLRPVLISAIENDFRENEIILEKPNKFFDIFVDEFIEEFTDIMRKETGKIYLDLFTEKELADIATFYRTDTGQKLIQKTPALMMAASQLGQFAGKKAGINAKSRVAKRLVDKGIIFNEDKGFTQRLIDYFK